MWIKNVNYDIIILRGDCMIYKVCNVCEESLPATLEYFNKRTNAKDGLQYTCKKCKSNKYFTDRECISAHKKAKYREKNPLRATDVIPEGFKRCCKCKNILPKTTDYFGINSRSKDGFKHSCKLCRHKYEYETKKEYLIEKSNKRYRLKKKQILKKNQAYKNKRTLWYKEYHKRYYIENCNTIKKRVKQNHYRRMKEHVGYLLLQRCRCRLYKAIKQNNKSKSTLELLGCSTDFLKYHLELQFKEGMSWDNYGEWEIDHIKPCSLFDFSNEEHQKECFHYSNLQPLWKKENQSKSSKY